MRTKSSRAASTFNDNSRNDRRGSSCVAHAAAEHMTVVRRLSRPQIAKALTPKPDSKEAGGPLVAMAQRRAPRDRNVPRAFSFQFEEKHERAMCKWACVYGGTATHGRQVRSSNTVRVHHRWNESLHRGRSISWQIVHPKTVVPPRSATASSPTQHTHGG